MRNLEVAAFEVMFVLCLVGFVVGGIGCTIELFTNDAFVYAVGRTLLISGVILGVGNAILWALGKIDLRR